MEAIADVLQPYKELVGSIAAIVTIGQMFSGSFLCWDIYKQGNTKGVGIMPFLGGVVMSILNLKYGYILRDDTMIQVNLFGLGLNIIYVMIYFNYTQEKMKVWGQIGFTGALSAGLIAYAQMEDPKLVENRLGTIITAFMFYLIASPLFGVKDIIKNKSTEGMPFPIIFSGTIVTFMWLLYGIILKNKFLVCLQMIAERASIYYSNPKYLQNSTIQVRRYSRNSPYYVNVRTTVIQTLANNMTLHVETYEFLHNEYKRSFVELHGPLCNMVNRNEIVHTIFAPHGITCPFFEGLNVISNLTLVLKDFPYEFPFTKGLLNISLDVTQTGEMAVVAHVYVTFIQKRKRARK